jgi:hypothetical protein
MMTIFLLLGLAGLLLSRSWALSANTDVPMYGEQTFSEFEVEGGQRLFRNGIMGRHVASGYVRAFEPGDEVVAITYAETDNRSGGDGAIMARGFVSGDFVLTISGVDRGDLGKPVYAGSDDPGDVALNGHPLAMLGRIVMIDGTDKCRVRFKLPGELPGRGEGGPMCLGGGFSKATGAAGGGTEYVDGDGFLVASALGLGVIPTDNGVQLSLDTTDEASHAGLVTAAKFDLDKVIVMQAEIAAYSVSGTAMSGTNVDLDFGLADAVVRSAVDPTRHVRFHVDGGDTTLLLGADDNSHDVAEADTTLELPKTLATAELYTLIVRNDGTVEAWAGATRITAPDLSAIDFTSGGYVAAFANVEKSSLAGVAIVEVRNIRCLGGF